MLSLQDIDDIVLNGGIVVDVAGAKIGSVEQVFTSGEAGDPVFVTVRTGLFGMSESFAPLSGARLDESVIRVACSKETVKNGPRIDSDRGTITQAQELELYSYYGLDTRAAEDGTDTEHAEGAGGGAEQSPAPSLPDGSRASPPAPESPPPPPASPAPPPHLHLHVPPRPGPHPGPPPPDRGPGEPRPGPWQPGPGRG